MMNSAECFLCRLPIQPTDHTLRYSSGRTLHSHCITAPPIGEDECDPRCDKCRRDNGLLTMCCLCTQFFCKDCLCTIPEVALLDPVCSPCWKAHPLHGKDIKKIALELATPIVE